MHPMLQQPFGIPKNGYFCWPGAESLVSLERSEMLLRPVRAIGRIRVTEGPRRRARKCGSRPS